MKREGPLGWYTVAVAFVALMFNYGIRYTNTVLFKNVQGDLHLTRSQASLPFTVCLLIYALGAPLVGRVVDRFGPKWVMAAGGLIAGVGLWLCSTMQSLPAFIIFFGVIFGLGGNGMGLVPSNTAVSYWFKEKLGLALGIATAGIGVGTVLLPPITNFFVNRWGWRTTFIILGVMIWALFVPLSLFLRRRPHAQSKQPVKSSEAINNESKGALKDALMSPNFWLLFFSFTLIVIAMYEIMLHQVPYAKDQGVSQWWATLSVTIVGLTSILGRLLFGRLSDRTPDRRLALLVAFALLFLSIIILMFVRNVVSLMVFAALYGFGYAGYGPIIPAIVSDIYGKANMGAIFGAITMGGALGGAAGPYIAGWLFDRTGSYSSAWLVAAIVALVSIVLVMKIKVEKIE